MAGLMATTDTPTAMAILTMAMGTLMVMARQDPPMIITMSPQIHMATVRAVHSPNNQIRTTTTVTVITTTIIIHPRIPISRPSSLRLPRVLIPSCRTGRVPMAIHLLPITAQRLPTETRYGSKPIGKIPAPAGSGSKDTGNPARRIIINRIAHTIHTQPPLWGLFFLHPVAGGQFENNCIILSVN